MPDIQYRFVESGKDSVKSAFREIGQEARASTKDVQALLKSIEQMGRVRGRGPLGGSSDGITSPVAARRAGGRGVDEAARDENRRQAREFKDRQSYQERLAKEVATGQARREKQESAERTKLRKQEHAESLKLQRAEESARKRGQADAVVDARKKATEEVSLYREKKRIEKQSEGSFKLGSTLKGAVIGGALTAGALGLGITGAAARDSLRLREVSNRLSISSRGAGEKAIDPAQLQKEFERTAIATPGLRAVDVADAVQQFVTKTGRLDVARASQQTFATVASASGSDIRDVSAAAADLFQKFDITSIEQMQEAFASLTMQGKAGAFELKDAAGQFGKLSAAASRFGIDKGVTGVKTLGGLTQIARTSTGSAEQASTAVEAMLRQLVAKSGDIGRLRVDGKAVRVFEKGSNSKTRNIQDVIADTIAGAKGSTVALQKIFGDEGIRGVSPLISAFNQAKDATAGTDKEKIAAGRAAVHSTLSGAIDAPGGWSEIQKDAALAQQDSSAKLTASWERLTAKVGGALIPVITQFVDSLTASPEVMDAFIGTIEVMIDAMKGFVLALEDLGIIKKKVKTPEQIADEKRAVAKDAQAEIEKIGTFTKVNELKDAGKFSEAAEMLARIQDPKNAARLGDLVAKRNVALQDAAAAEGDAANQRDRQNRIRTPEEFAKEYAALGAPGSRANALGADIGQNIAAGPFSIASQYAKEGALSDESEAQRQLRVGQIQASQQEKTRTLGVTGDDQVGSAKTGLADFAASAKAAAEAMKAIAAQGQANPLGAT
jgi:hypothetical protein